MNLITLMSAAEGKQIAVSPGERVSLGDGDRLIINASSQDVVSLIKKGHVLSIAINEVQAVSLDHFFDQNNIEIEFTDTDWNQDSSTGINYCAYSCHR